MLLAGLALSLLMGLLLFMAAAPGLTQPTAFAFKDQDGVPVTGTVRVLCFDGVTAVSPFADLNIQVTAGTPDAPLPERCTHLAALRLRHTQPAGKHDAPAYQVYAASWEPGDTRPLTVTGDIILSDARPLTLLNMVVSLGWTPADGSGVTDAADIRLALQNASAELYDWTEGQMAIGAVSIHTGGERWNEADLRFLPANDKRPSAFVGGIVSDTLTYAAYLTNTTYTPAMSYFGRLWDGADAFDEANGRWPAANGSRTIAHEWAHYALFLYDEYQNTSGASGYCTCAALPGGCGFGDRDGSAMAYHYQATEFWHKDTHLTVDLFCYNTWQAQVHGMNDWETLARWHEIQNLPLSFPPLAMPFPELDAGPEPGLAAHLFGAEPGRATFLPVVLRDGDPPVATRSEPFVNLLVNAASPPTVTQPSQVYLLKGGSSPARILPQGRAVGDVAGSVLGQLRLLDVEPDDVVRAYVGQTAVGPSPGVRYTTFTNGSPTAGITTEVNPLRFTLDHYFTIVNGRAVTLTIALKDEDNALGVPAIQICSLDAAVGCDPAWKMEMTPDGGWLSAEFAPLPGQAELPRYLVLRIWDDNDSAVEKEIVQWVQMAGGVGPAHNDGMAPLVDDAVMVNIANPLATAPDCNVVSYTPATHAGALQAPLPAGFGGLLGLPLDISITINEDQCPTRTPGQDEPLPPNRTVLLNFGYSQDEVTRLGVPEGANLELLHFSNQSGWTTVQQISVNSELNWIAARIFEDGVYAVGWRP
jgi:hypothetical protein